MTPFFSQHLTAPLDCPTFLPTPPPPFSQPQPHTVCPHPNTLSTPLPTPQTHFPTPQTHFHTPTPYTPYPQHIFPYLLPHPNTFPTSSIFTPYLTQLPKIPPPSILPQILYTPPFFPLVLLCLLVLSVICGQQTACKQVVAANGKAYRIGPSHKALYNIPCKQAY